MALRMTILFTALMLAFASSATAGSSSSSTSLPVGGNTIGGPGSGSAVLDATDVVADGVAEDVCVTVASKPGSSSGILRLELINDEAMVSSTNITSGTTKALCQNDNETVQLVCVGPTSCSYSWRIDRK